MKYRIQKSAIIFAAVVILLAGCTYTGFVHAVDSDEMIKLQSSLIYLTTKVDDLYRTNKVLPATTNETILDMVAEKDPNTKNDFKAYAVKFKSELGHAVVLVCTKDSQVALLEMSACSMGPDKKPWQSSQPVLCQFSIDETYMEKACGIGK